MADASLPTSIEIFPVELYRELFLYFNGFQLYRTFRGINSKIDSILQQTPLYFNFWNITKNDYSVIQFVNVQSVYSLKLSASDYRGGRLFNDYPLNSFTQLRLFHLYYISGPSLPVTELASLEHLQTLIISVSSGGGGAAGEILRLVNLIFNENGTVGPSHFRSTLKRLEISASVPTKNAFHPDRFRPSKTNIQHLEIGAIQFHDFIRLLPSLELVRSVRVKFEYRTDTTSEHFFFNNADFKPILIPHCSILTLPFDHTDISFVHIEYLLKCTPHLKKLTIDIDEYHGELRDNHQKWKALLNDYCTNLQKFKFNYWWGNGLRSQEEYASIKNFHIVFPTANRETPNHPESCDNYDRFTVHFKKEKRS